MKRKSRLKRSADFQRVRRFGKSYAHPLIVLAAIPNEQDFSRFGFIAGGSVGGAVERNRAKRRMRAVVYESMDQLPSGWDIVLIARKPILGAPYVEIQKAIASLLKRAQILTV